MKEVEEKCLPPKNCEDLLAAEAGEEIRGIITSDYAHKREKNYLTIHRPIMAGMKYWHKE